MKRGTRQILKTYDPLCLEYLDRDLGKQKFKVLSQYENSKDFSLKGHFLKLNDNC